MYAYCGSVANTRTILFPLPIYFLRNKKGHKVTCHAHYSVFWLRGYQARLLGEPLEHSRIYQGQARMDWEAGHKKAGIDVAI